jgi:hypothetical protein
MEQVYDTLVTGLAFLFYGHGHTHPDGTLRKFLCFHKLADGLFSFGLSSASLQAKSLRDEGKSSVFIPDFHI